MLKPRSLGALTAVLPAHQAARLEAASARVREALAGRVVWNVSATQAGGGVAEMLRTLLGYLNAAGVESRWLVLDGDEEFFSITKGLHNAVHGRGDPSSLGPAAHAGYQRVLGRNLPALRGQVRSRDLVLLHDPQSAGLLRPLRDAGVRVAWRSHIGRDTPNEQSVAAWEFLRRYAEHADALVFSRSEHAPAWARDRLWVIPPSIDPLAPKNRQLSTAERRRALGRVGLATAARAGRPAQTGGAPLPGRNSRLILQVSRWDRLKDMPGVMAGFARAGMPEDVHLVLAAPAVTGVTDDPEGAEVLAGCMADWRRLPAGIRDRVSLLSVPMDDPDENATIVNAIQRQALIITQKSLAEGFGLTVAEAMWKAKPVVASAVGGIRDQITDGRDGLLIDDPADVDAFAHALRRLLLDQDLARAIARAARQRVLENFLDDRQLVRCGELFKAMSASA